MDSPTDLCLKRANNELILASIIQRVSNENPLKKDVFQIDQDLTFYSAVISHAYYAIFNSAKAYLISKGVVFPRQGQHQKAYQEFSKNVKKGVINKELLKMYDEVKIKAEELLGIFEKEREKRGKFTYERLPQANKQPAEESLENAQKFYRQIYALISK